jgi:hemoglobin
MRQLKTIAFSLGLVALVTAGHVHAAETLYGDLGERPGLVKIVDDLVEIYLKDDRIKDEFDNINLDRLKMMLVDQFCVLSGGPCEYKGRDMKTVHKGLHLDTADFNALVEDLQTAMDRSKIPFATQNRLLAPLAPMHRDIVTR